MQVCRILHEMMHIKQDQKSVTEYAGELKRLYRDLEFFRPLKPHDPRDLPLLREWFEPMLVKIFLDGLNPEFKIRSEMIFAMPEWSTLEETISSILEEETHLSNQIIPQANAAKFEYKRKPRSVSDHCKRPGHMKKNCFELIGYPPGW